MITEEIVLNKLKNVIDPDLNKDIVSLGFVKDVKICGGNISVTIELTTPACPMKDKLRDHAIQLIESIPAVTSVTVNMTARVRTKIEPKDMLKGVKHVIAVASGKGGVGKSTVSVNLAVALAQTGASVGLMDADVYGPSIPKMLGCEDEKPWVENHKIMPIERFGLKIISLGFLVDDSAAVIWRGPLVASTVKQLLSDVEWGELDYLIVDLPPGTGDSPMTLAQTVSLSGVVIVLTPQDVAAGIAAKSIQLFTRLKAPILGVIENMSEFICANCGHVTRIFSGSRGNIIADKLNLPFLGSIPLDPVISESGDNGKPSIIAYPDHKQADVFREIAGKLAQQISILSVEAQAEEPATPAIRLEK